MEFWTKIKIGGLLAAGLLLILAFSGADTLTPRAYAQWVENPANGLCLEKTIAPLRFTIQYKPLDYIVALEERQEELPGDLLERRKAELGNEMDYYNFRISPVNGQQNVLMQTARDENEYFQLIDYFSYSAQEDFYLLHGSDTSKCVLYQFVRNYELSPHLDFALGFERKDATAGEQTFVFDSELLRTGEIKAKIDRNKIRQIPQLKTQ